MQQLLDKSVINERQQDPVNMTWRDPGQRGYLYLIFQVQIKGKVTHLLQRHICMCGHFSELLQSLRAGIWHADTWLTRHLWDLCSHQTPPCATGAQGRAELEQLKWVAEVCCCHRSLPCSSPMLNGIYRKGSSSALQRNHRWTHTVGSIWFLETWNHCQSMLSIWSLIAS